ncbi:MAG: hypothetical protein SOY60_05115 [Fusobacterium gastrosuis]|uniref:hypothetical protein n=1 Tax=Fusobacterium gastrosuis TaxID=1755100 RepID=UPI0029763A49|nr:hypothetical protein [Fusobacteriaceae bacterium]MDY4011026.1 hypothetical protein [Fusobacterium gastrosuis]MDY5714142.1 hypothetical protein [Fusobacterium gastrosuis]
MEKIKRNLKSNLKRKVRITEALLTFFLITGGIGFANEGNYPSIAFSEDSTVLGNNSYNFSKNSSVVGNNNLATGSGTKEENLQKVAKYYNDLKNIENIEREVESLNEVKNRTAFRSAEISNYLKEGRGVNYGYSLEELNNIDLSDVNYKNYTTELNNVADDLKSRFEKKLTDENKRIDLEIYKNYVTEKYFKTLDIDGISKNATKESSVKYWLHVFKDAGLTFKSEEHYQNLNNLIYDDENPLGENAKLKKALKYYSDIKTIGSSDISETEVNDIVKPYLDAIEESTTIDKFLEVLFVNIFGKNTYSATEPLRNSRFYIDALTDNGYNQAGKDFHTLKFIKSSDDFSKYKQDTDANFNNLEIISEEPAHNYHGKSDVFYKDGNYYLTTPQRGLSTSASNTDEHSIGFGGYEVETSIAKYIPNNIYNITENNFGYFDENGNYVKTHDSILNENEKLYNDITVKEYFENAKKLYKNYTETDRLNKYISEDIAATEAVEETLKTEVAKVSEEINDKNKEIIKKKGELEKPISGKNNIIAGDNNVVIGNDNSVTGNNIDINGDLNVAIGTGHIINGTASTAIGDPNVIFGNNNHVIGNDNSVGTRDNPKNNVFILGSNVDATNVEDAVVLGNNSQAVTGTVSVGATGNERKIINVAAGIADTDAVNVSQLNTKLDKTEFTGEKISAKLTKGNITSNDLEVSGTGKLLDSNISLVIKDGAITKDKLDDNLKTEINNKANSSDVYTKTQTYSKPEIDSLLGDKVSTSDLNGYVKKDGSNIDSASKVAITEKLNENANIENPTDTLVTDRNVKDYIDSKNFASSSDLANKANVDATNIDIDKYTEKLSQNSNMENPEDKLVTDTKVKEYLNNNYYTNTEVDSKLANIKVETNADIKSTTLAITNGTDRLIGEEDVFIELKENSISKNKLDNTLKNEIDNKANINGNNIVTSKDKADFRKNIEVYSKAEIENKLNSITVNGADLTGEITATEEKGVTGKTIYNYVSKRDALIINNYEEIQKNKQAIADNSRRINEVEKDVKKVGALTTAMAAIEYPKVGVGEVAIGAGITSFRGEQGIAVGAQYMPIEDLLLGIKYAGLTSDRYRGAVGGSIGYKFRLHD